MQIQYLSDLHLEFGSDIGKKVEIDPKADVFVLAGDIHTTPKGMAKFIRRLRKKTDIPIIYVLGNHEYYGYDIQAFKNNKTYEKALKEFDNVFVLDNDTCEIDDILFIGSTLYSDLSNPIHSISVHAGLTDFRVVTVEKEKLTPSDWHSMWLRSTGFITTQLANRHDEGKLDKTVVITHFSPSFKLHSKRYTGSSITHGFHSNLEHLLHLYTPALWIYGHTHDTINTKIGGCPVVTNQYGYVHEPWLNLEIKTKEI